MSQDSALISPLDAHYTGHREEARRRRETRDWLKQRERELGFVEDAPAVAPDLKDRH